MELAMSCVLRVSGEYLDIDALLQSQNLIPIVTWRKGGERFLKGRLHTDSGANFEVSHAEIEDVARQVADAERYLATNYNEISILVSAAGCTNAVLDFAVATRPGFVTQTSSFSSSFVQHVAELGLALAVSHYPTQDDVEENT
jgi:hypothetical protein